MTIDEVRNLLTDMGLKSTVIPGSSVIAIATSFGEYRFIPSLDQPDVVEREVRQVKAEIRQEEAKNMFRTWFRT